LPLPGSPPPLFPFVVLPIFCRGLASREGDLLAPLCVHNDLDFPPHVPPPSAPSSTPSSFAQDIDDTKVPIPTAELETLFAAKPRAAPKAIADAPEKKEEKKPDTISYIDAKRSSNIGRGRLTGAAREGKHKSPLVRWHTNALATDLLLAEPWKAREHTHGQDNPSNE